MAHFKAQSLAARRRVLQNPYAHLEELEEARLERLHQNPYLFADRQEQDEPSPVQGPRTHGISAIERIATELQRKLWVRRGELGTSPDIEPVDILQPEYAARLLGYTYSTRSSLGWILRGPNKIEVAGLIDVPKRRIEVSSDIESRVARFTGAHEVGHAVLHPHLTGLHRDRPLGGAAESRDRVEYEADKFATFFLMPQKLVREQFFSRFLGPFELQDETAYALLGKPLAAAQEQLPTRRRISEALAAARYFNGHNFMPLSDYFGVSIKAMAIRLEELGLA